METSKTCKHCQLVKPLDAFYKQKGGRLGYTAQCKECRKAYRRRPEVRARQSAYNRAYRARPGMKDKLREYHRQYRERNREKVRLRMREYCKQWARDNRDKTNAYRRKSRLGKGRACILAADHRYQAKKRAAPGLVITPQINHLLDLCERKCLVCGTTDRLSLDHIVPISLGGCCCIHNLQPLCRPCNARKGNRNQNDYRTPEIHSWLATIPSADTSCSVHS